MKSRRSKVKKQTDSIVANLRPIQARGPNKKKGLFIYLEKSYRSMRWEKKIYIPILKAEKDSSLEIPYQREGLYFSGSSKYRGLYSVKKS